MTDKELFQIELGKRIRFLREEKGLSLEKLGNMSGLDKPNMSRIENGQINPTIYTLKKISVALQMDVSSLLSTL